jgi:hypothetical protein
VEILLNTLIVYIDSQEVFKNLLFCPTVWISCASRRYLQLPEKGSEMVAGFNAHSRGVPK